MAVYYATDRAVVRLSGNLISPEIISVNFSMTNNATIQQTFTEDRTAQVIVLGNVSGNVTIVESILQGGKLIDFFSQDVAGSSLTIHPASNSYRAPRQLIEYNGQVQQLTLLAFDGYDTSYPGAGTGASRGLKFLVGNVTQIDS